MLDAERAIVWIHGDVKSPPFSTHARKKVGSLLRVLQLGGKLQMPIARPLPIIGPRCYELRINDVNVTWRIIYRVDRTAVLILDVFKKKTEALPFTTIETCVARIQWYDAQEDQQ